MALLSDRTIAMVRRNVSAMLTERCTIERESGATDDMGAPLHDWTVVASDVPCRVIRAGQRNNNSTEIIGSQEALVEMYRLICPVATPFKTDDRVRMADGAVYQIVAMDDRMTDQAFVSAIITRGRE